MLTTQGIITSSARSLGFPVPLCSVAEQVYLSSLLHGFGADDDAGVVRVYCPGLVPPSSKLPAERILPSNAAYAERMQLVIALLKAIHLTAAMEALALTVQLGLEGWQFITLVNEAAGASWEFRNYTATFQSRPPDQDPPEPETLASYMDSLTEAVVTARELNCPLFLGNATLEVLTSVKRRGVTLAHDIGRYYKKG